MFENHDWPDEEYSKTMKHDDEMNLYCSVTTTIRGVLRRWNSKTNFGFDSRLVWIQSFRYSISVESDPATILIIIVLGSILPGRQYSLSDFLRSSLKETLSDVLRHAVFFLATLIGSPFSTISTYRLALLVPSCTATIPEFEWAASRKGRPLTFVSSPVLLSRAFCAPVIWQFCRKIILPFRFLFPPNNQHSRFVD